MGYEVFLFDIIAVPPCHHASPMADPPEYYEEH